MTVKLICGKYTVNESGGCYEIVADFVRPGVDRTKSEPTRKNPKTAHQINKGKQAVGYQEWLNSFRGLDLGPVKRNLMRTCKTYPNCPSPGSLELYSQQIPMPIQGRVRMIDPCISHIVAALNAAGIKTIASCCGHGKRDGSIMLEDGRELVILCKKKVDEKYEF